MKQMRTTSAHGSARAAWRVQVQQIAASGGIIATSSCRLSRKQENKIKGTMTNSNKKTP